MVRQDRDAIGLVLGGRVLPWSFAGYGEAVPVPPGAAVEVLTPLSVVAAIVSGYRPGLHPTAR